MGKVKVVFNHSMLTEGLDLNHINKSLLDIYV